MLMLGMLIGIWIGVLIGVTFMAIFNINHYEDE